MHCKSSANKGVSWISLFVEKDSGHASALAYANGACVCLSKPVSLVELTNAIAALQSTARQLAVA
jgi:DNA-binding response OmpR family regulator